jgi:hypothetical protein
MDELGPEALIMPLCELKVCDAIIDYCGVELSRPKSKHWHASQASRRPIEKEDSSFNINAQEYADDTIVTMTFIPKNVCFFRCKFQFCL